MTPLKKKQPIHVLLSAVASSRAELPSSKIWIAAGSSLQNQSFDLRARQPARAVGTALYSLTYPFYTVNLRCVVLLYTMDGGVGQQTADDEAKPHPIRTTRDRGLL